MFARFTVKYLVHFQGYTLSEVPDFFPQGYRFHDKTRFILQGYHPCTPEMQKAAYEHSPDITRHGERGLNHPISPSPITYNRMISPEKGSHILLMIM